MVKIQPDEKLNEVMRRTMFNLRYVKSRAAMDGPFEVVQLVNSFSGAMVHPWENMRRLDALGLKTKSMREALDEGWPILEKELPTEDKDPANYGQMLQWIRNGIAHGNVNFENTDGQITSVRVWSCEFRPPHNREWGTVVSVRRMEEFLYFFCNLAAGSIPQPLPENLRIFAYAAD